MSASDDLARALKGVGFPADDPELARTPDLVTQMWAEFAPGPVPSVTPLPTESTDLVVLRQLPYYSLCAHHLLPFFGTCTLAVRPDGAVAGFGWYPRVLEALSRRPQLQERLADELAHAILDGIGARSVGVRITARQMCMEMRGARSAGEIEVVALRGADDAAVEAAVNRRG